MTEDFEIHCDKHGTSKPNGVCRHIHDIGHDLFMHGIEPTDRCGFNVDDDLIISAVCDSCVEHGKITALVCDKCFEELRAICEHCPDDGRGY